MNAYFGRLKRFIFSPKLAFEKEKKGDFGSAFKFMLPLFVFLAVIGTIVSSVTAALIPHDLSLTYTPLSALSGMLISFVGAIIGTIIGGLWFHLWLYVMGAKKGLERTLEVAMYSSVPSLLLGWLPAAGLAFIYYNAILAISAVITGFAVLFIWELYLLVVGIKLYQEMKGSRIGIAFLFSIGIPLLIIIALALFALGLFYTVGVVQ